MHKLLKLRQYITMLAMALMMLSVSAQAATVDAKDPYKMMNTVAEKAFSRFKAEQAKVDADPNYLKQMFEEELMPYVDYQYAALKILGPSLRGADKKEVQEFITTFREYLVTSAAQALTEYSGQTIRINDGKPVADDARIETVRVDVLQDGKPPVAVDFKLIKNKKTGDWKVYDIIGEGISLLSSKQSEWQTKIRQQGIASVSTEMAKLAKAPIKKEVK